MASFDLDNITLSYPVFHAPDLSVKLVVRKIATGGMIRHRTKRHVEVLALDGVSLSAKDGDKIGIIGHNGAGKTSLIKVVAGIYRPQQGRIIRHGKTVAVINPSMGIDPQLTGYDNIKILCLLSGLTRCEIKSQISEIAEFTELGDFLKLPVATYSAGMQMRLAFAVATSLHPDILIADENLGTGDTHFLKRAQERMRAMMDRSSILVLASHSLPNIKEMCNRAILLEHGRIVFDGSVHEAISRYQQQQTV